MVDLVFFSFLCCAPTHSALTQQALFTGFSALFSRRICVGCELRREPRCDPSLDATSGLESTSKPSSIGQANVASVTVALLSLVHPSSVQNNLETELVRGRSEASRASRSFDVIRHSSIRFDDSFSFHPPPKSHRALSYMYIHVRMYYIVVRKRQGEIKQEGKNACRWLCYRHRFSDPFGC